MQFVHTSIGRSIMVACLSGFCLSTYGTGIDVPESQVLKLSFNAEGVQIYECVASAGDVFSWVFKAPEAGLYDPDGKLGAIHYAGPTWESVSDGSKIHGQRVSSSPSEEKDAIPQLLLSAIVVAHGAMFEDVTFIQRLNTRGGAAPQSGCDANASIKQVSVPYSARYDFFRRQ